MELPQLSSDQLDHWLNEQATPWGRIRYRVVQHNLRYHLRYSLNEYPMRILDAGGGNGRDSLPFAAEGHEVTLVDSSNEMLAQARSTAQEQGLQDRFQTIHADIRDLPRLFPSPTFDLVLCHNVIQYTADPIACLSKVIAPLTLGGRLSLISLNRYSEAYHAAFLRNDLEEALAKLDARSLPSTLFSTDMKVYGSDEIINLLPQVGLSLEGQYGVRCLFDYWGDNAKKSDPETYDKLEKLEIALSSRFPYKLLARAFHLIARNDGLAEE